APGPPGGGPWAVGGRGSCRPRRACGTPPFMIPLRPTSLREPAPAAIKKEDRWRLILGTERDRLPPSSMRAAAALDELYGEGHGEGSNSSLGGGSEAPAPSAREWAEEL